jgi:DedD protein
LRYNDDDRAAVAALGFGGFAPIVDTLVKERLTGALILVGLVVVLVPELLSGPIRPASHAHGPAASAEEPPLRSYTISLADEPHGGGGAARPQPSTPAAPAMPAAEPAAAPAASDPGQPAAGAPAAVPTIPPVSTPSAAAPPHAAPAPSSSPPMNPPPAAAAGAYMVQLGSFANRANAERLAQQVHALGYPVAVSRGTTGRRLYRVQAGPARDRAAAEQMAAKLHAQGHDGKVVPK